MDRLASDRMFAAVVETGSFAGAAQRLGTSSGYASKLVARIEGELGVRLLHRTTRALQLTEAGQTYYNRVRGILDELDQLDAEMRSTSTTPRGKVGWGSARRVTRSCTTTREKPSSLTT